MSVGAVTLRGRSRGARWSLRRRTAGRRGGGSGSLRRRPETEAESARPQKAHSADARPSPPRCTPRGGLCGLKAVTRRWRPSPGPELATDQRPLAGGGIFSVWPICSFCGSCDVVGGDQLVGLDAELLGDRRRGIAGSGRCRSARRRSGSGAAGGGGGATTAIGVGVGGVASAAARPGPVAQFRPTYRKPASAATTTTKPMMYGPWRLSRRAWLPWTGWRCSARGNA